MDTLNGPKRLGTLFKECVLRVPPYQRAYAWCTKPNLDSFLSDLRSHPYNTEKSYFYGTILLSRARDIRLRHLVACDVVDGQQRLTTACIFIMVAIERLRKDPEQSDLAHIYHETFIKDRLDGRKLSTVESDDGFFERYILGEATYDSSQFSTPSQRRLLEARSYFMAAIEELDVEELIRLVSTLHDSQVLVYAVESDIEATQIFELQNDRGRPLTNLEALKSFLMYGLYLYAKDDIRTDLPIVQKNFASIYRAAEIMEGMYDHRSEDELLSDHCIAFEEWRTVDGGDGWSQPKQLVRAILHDVPHDAKGAWIKNFSYRLCESFQMAQQIMEARDAENGIALGELTALGRTAAYWPLMLKCWKSDRVSGRPNFERVIRGIESFAFRAIIGGKRTDRGTSELRRWARDLDNNFEALITRLSQMRNDREILESFRFNLRSEHLFEWWGNNVTYLLWRYENHLRKRTGRQMPRLSWKTIVLPERPAVKYQRDHIEAKDPANPRLAIVVKWNPEDEERPFGEVCLHRLGNLVLDTYSSGSAKGNGDFASRISHYTGSGLQSQSELVPCFASKDENGNPIWDICAIRKRQEALEAFVIDEL